MPVLEANHHATKWSCRKLYTLMMVMYHQNDATSPDPRVIGETTSEMALRAKTKQLFMENKQHNEGGLSWMLLGMKMRGFGQGRWNGYGGKVEAEDASPKAAALREMHEESGLVIDPSTIEEFGRFWFTFEGDAKCMEVHAYINWNWKPNVTPEGSLEWPQNTEEMHANWFPIATRKKTSSSDPISTARLFGHNILDTISFDTSHIPLDNMWPDDQIWLPHLLRGQHMIGWLHCCPAELADTKKHGELVDQNKENLGLKITQFRVPGYRFEFFSLQRTTEGTLNKSSPLAKAIDRMKLNHEDRLRQWMSSRENIATSAAVSSTGTTAEVILFG